MIPTDPKYNFLTAVGGTRTSQTQGYEIDIFEQYGKLWHPSTGKNQSSFTIHAGTQWNDPDHLQASNLDLDQEFSFDPAAAFHTYAIEWTPEQIIWFVDGVEAYQANLTPKSPFYVMLDFYQDFGPKQQFTDPYPQAFSIGHVRAYALTKAAGLSGNDLDSAYSPRAPRAGPLKRKTLQCVMTLRERRDSSVVIASHSETFSLSNLYKQEKLPLWFSPTDIRRPDLLTVQDANKFQGIVWGQDAPYERYVLQIRQGQGLATQSGDQVDEDGNLVSPSSNLVDQAVRYHPLRAAAQAHGDGGWGFLDLSCRENRVRSSRAYHPFDVASRSQTNIGLKTMNDRRLAH